MKKWKKTLLATSGILLSSMAFAGNGQSQANSEFPIPAGFESSFKDVNGVKLHYVVGGEGPLLLMVHGFAQSWYEWHQLMPKLAEEYQVVAMDLPGLGLSESLNSSYTGQDVSPYIHSLAKTFSPEEKFNVIAHDIGGWVTYPMLAQHQNDIDKVALLETIVPSDLIYTFPAYTPQGESTAWHFSFFSAKNELAESLISGNEDKFFKHFILEHAENKNAFSEELFGMYADSYKKPQTLHAAFEYYRALPESVIQNDNLSENNLLKMPILAISGNGQGSLGKTQINQMKEYANDVQGHVLESCGHWLMEECPVQVESIVTDFFDKK
ncbi:alpha/beta hydrolase [Vibrio alginolyticus]|nr:alpha/beta hydrolase [Vibrio alginolyticus]ELB1639377.1 alpha/beta hydrolase [Vibrio alginolyticus]